MEIRDFKNIVVNILVMLLVVTIFFFLYNLINPFDFPGLWQRLLLFDIGFGILSFVLHFSEIVLFLKKIKKPWGRENGYKPFKPKRYHPGLYKFNFRKIIERFKSCKSSLDKLNTLSKRNKWKFLLISGGVVVYGIFLAWVFPKVSFDEFMFFILLLYIPLSLRLKLDSRYPIVVGLLLLVVCVVVLIQGFEDYANRIAIYAYYFLVIGVALLFIDYLREPKREI